MLPFFWQHGEDEKTLRHYMNVIYHANIRAVCVESRPHPDFVGPKWWQDMDVIIDEAKKLGMKVWILDDEHCPTGLAAGALKNAPAELHHQYLDYYRVDVCGPQPQTQVLIDQYIHPKDIPESFEGEKYQPLKDDHLFKVLACPVVKGGKLGEPEDITHLVEDGVLTWDVPAGYHLIFVLYLTRDAKGQNNQINFIDKESCRLMISAVYEPHWEHYKEEFGKTIAGFFTDEPQIGNSIGFKPRPVGIGSIKQTLPWSSYVPGRMDEAFGSQEWTRYLPYLWWDAEDTQMRARIRTVYMDVLSKLVQECFSEQLGDWCEEHGVEYIGHVMESDSSRMGPNLIHFFRCMAGQHMGGIDSIGNCVLIGGQDVLRSYEAENTGEADFFHYAIGKLGVSQGALEPKKKGRCMCENFGSYGWQAGVKDFKYYMDFFLVRGVNHYVPHAFSPKAFPDPDNPPHFYAHGENPQYKAFGELMAYSNRVCHLISDGKAHPVAAVLYHGESDWAGSFEKCSLAARALTTAQIDFHIVPADVYGLKETYNTVIEPGKFSVNGNEYQALVLPGCEYLYRDAAELAAALLKVGIPVYITGEYPKGISNCTREESEALFGSLKGMVHTDAEELAVKVRTTAVCDVNLDQTFANLTYYHYTTDSENYLFLNEDTKEAFEGEITVNAVGVPYLYDAWENRVYPLSYRQEEGRTKISLKILPLDMAIVTFDETLQDVAVKMPKETGTCITLDHFDISLAEAKAYPDFTLTGLHDSKKSIALSYPDFSGWIRYEAEFDIPEDTVSGGLLKIDDVYESAEVYVNDICVGTRVARPYLYDVRGALRPGKNTVRIDAATTLYRKIVAMGAKEPNCNVDNALAPTGIVGKVSVYI